MNLRRFLAGLLAFAASGAVVVASPAPEASAQVVTTQTPVMGPSLLTADQLVNWYNSKGFTPRLPALNNDVRALAQLFIDEGAFEGVRGDIAFVQAVLETGGFSYSDNGQIRPEFNNYGGINAFDGRPKGTTCAAETAPSRCFATPQLGVRNSIHLLRGYADATTKNLTDRLRMPPSNRVGYAPIWEMFGGEIPAGCGSTSPPCQKLLVWASSQTYAENILKLYSQALVMNGARAACLPYFPGASSNPSGNGYWVALTDKSLYSFGSAQFHGNPVPLNLNQPLINGESLAGGTGYWLLAQDGGVFSFGAAQFFGSMGGTRLNAPVNGIERTNNNGGYWLVARDGGIFSFGNAQFFGSTGSLPLNKPVLGMERTKSGKGYWLFAEDGGIFSFGDAAFHGSLGGQALSAPIVSMQRSASGNGYWMLGADGKVYSFGDAQNFGGIEGCPNYFFATRILVTPSGSGYWIATATGSVVAFGDARRLGFPSRVGGIPIALMLAQ